MAGWEMLSQMISQGSILTTCFEHLLFTRHCSVLSTGLVLPLDSESRGPYPGSSGLETPPPASSHSMR